MKVIQQVWRKYEEIVDLKVPEGVAWDMVEESFFDRARTEFDLELVRAGWEFGRARSQVNEVGFRAYNRETGCYEVKFEAI